MFDLDRDTGAIFDAKHWAVRYETAIDTANAMRLSPCAADPLPLLPLTLADRVLTVLSAVSSAAAIAVAASLLM